MAKEGFLKQVPSGLTVFSAALGGVAVWGLAKMRPDNVPQTLGVVAAIAIGGYNAWKAWSKERKDDKPKVRASLNFDGGLGQLCCRIENTSTLTVWIEAVKLQSLTKDIDVNSLSMVLGSVSKASSGWEIRANECAIIRWPEFRHELAVRYGVCGAEVVPSTSKPFLAEAAVLEPLITQYKSLPKNGNGVVPHEALRDNA